MHEPIWLKQDELSFPDPEHALKEPNGLLAVGGDLSLERLIAAYKLGIFPWYEAGQPAGWIASIVGAIVILFIYSLVRSKSAR